MHMHIISNAVCSISKSYSYVNTSVVFCAYEACVWFQYLQIFQSPNEKKHIILKELLKKIKTSQYICIIWFQIFPGTCTL